MATGTQHSNKTYQIQHNDIQDNRNNCRIEPGVVNANCRISAHYDECHYFECHYIEYHCAE